MLFPLLINLNYINFYISATIFFNIFSNIFATEKLVVQYVYTYVLFSAYMLLKIDILKSILKQIDMIAMVINR